MATDPSELTAVGRWTHKIDDSRLPIFARRPRFRTQGLLPVHARRSAGSARTTVTTRSPVCTYRMVIRPPKASLARRSRTSAPAPPTMTTTGRPLGAGSTPSSTVTTSRTRCCLWGANLRPSLSSGAAGQRPGGTAALSGVVTPCRLTTVRSRGNRASRTSDARARQRAS
jgi:hypothetical protein